MLDLIIFLITLGSFVSSVLSSIINVVAQYCKPKDTYLVTRIVGTRGRTFCAPSEEEVDIAEERQQRKLAVRRLEQKRKAMEYTKNVEKIMATWQAEYEWEEHQRRRWEQQEQERQQEEYRQVELERRRMEVKDLADIRREAIERAAQEEQRRQYQQALLCYTQDNRRANFWCQQEFKYRHYQKQQAQKKAKVDAYLNHLQQQTPTNFLTGLFNNVQEGNQHPR